MKCCHLWWNISRTRWLVLTKWQWTLLGSTFMMWWQNETLYNYELSWLNAVQTSKRVTFVGRGASRVVETLSCLCSCLPCKQGLGLTGVGFNTDAQLSTLITWNQMRCNNILLTSVYRIHKLSGWWYQEGIKWLRRIILAVLCVQ